MSDAFFPVTMPANRTDTVEGGWRECFEQFAPKLLLFARQWVQATADAEDVVQEGFVRCWRHRGGQAAANPALLFAAHRSAALDARRKEQRRRRRELATMPASEHSPFTCPLEDRELRDVVQSALQQLPLEQREVLVLRIWGELSFPEIADVMEVGVDTAASRHRYALAALRKLIPTNPLT